MSQHTTFYYHSIGFELFHVLQSHLDRGESFTLLGSRAVGKRYVMEKVAEKLTEAGIVVIHTEMDSPSPIYTEAEILNHLRTHTQSRNLLIPGEIDSFEELFAWFRNEKERRGSPVIFMLANVGRMAESLLTHFLHLIRCSVDEGSVIVGITGEADLSGLVHGKLSPFACSHQYVLQYHDRDSFRWFFDRFCEGLNLPPEFYAQGNPCSQLYEKTGGDIRLLHHTLIAQSTRLPVFPFEPVGDSFLEYPHPRIWGLEPFLVIQRHVECLKPEDLPVLRNLVQSKHGCFLPPAHRGTNGLPHPLELIGLARRDHEVGDKITLASPFMASFARHYFSGVRLGDLFARAEQWEEAFRCYETVPIGAGRLRPVSTSDYPQVRNVIETLSAKLFQIVVIPTNADKMMDEIAAMLDKGLRLILGNQSVAFCRFDRDSEQWLNIKDDKPLMEGQWLEKEGIRLLDISQWVGERDGNYHAVIAAQNQRLFAAVVTNSPGKRMPRQHKELTLFLLNRFAHIWRHAQNVVLTERRLLERQEIMGITGDVLEKLGQEIIDVPVTLQSVCDKIVATQRFKRAVWFMCRPDQRQLQKMAESCADVVNLPDKLLVLLDHGNNLEPNRLAEALRGGITLVERDPQRSAYLPQELRTLLVGPCIIVPVHDASHDPVGVMLVEAMTQANRFSALKRDLFDLGKRLSSLIRQAERIETKRKAMSAISDPLIILGNDRRVRFANRDAARILGKPEIAERWISRIDAVSLADTTIPLDILQVIQGLVNDQNERNGSCFELRQDQKPRFWNVTATPLLDCFELPGGHLIRMRNRTTVRGAFQVLYQVAASTSVSDAIEVFFDAATKLSLSPPKMARYYRIDECDPNVLVSFRAKGFAEQAKLLAFESGQIRLNRDEDISALDVLPQNIDWPLPRIWQWNQVGDHGSVEWTAKGLPYKITNQGYHAEALEKKPGDFWIDFPLCVRDRDTDAWKALGKITLSFGETDELITPESLDYLSWMAGVLAQFFSSLHDHEGRLSDVIVAEEKALATASHNIRTMVAGLAGYPTRFDGLLDDMTLALKRAHGVDPSLNSTLSEVASRLSSLSSELRKSHGAIDQVLHRMKDRLRGISLGLLERISIRSLVEEASRILPDWVPLEIHGDVEAEVDKTYMLLALQELMLDSVKYRVLDRPLKITVSLEKQHDQRIRIGYSDNGRGVPPAMKERIFEPFVRFSNPTEGQSTGVGLYFVRNVIAAHKGAIKESGVLGEGVCFSIILQESPHVITVNHEIELIGI